MKSKSIQTPEERFIDALRLDRLTEPEVKYPRQILGRINHRSMTPQRARELFLKKFPNTKWIIEVDPMKKLPVPTAYKIGNNGTPKKNYKCKWCGKTTYRTQHGLCTSCGRFN